MSKPIAGPLSPQPTHENAPIMRAAPATAEPEPLPARVDAQAQRVLEEEKGWQRIAEKMLIPLRPPHSYRVCVESFYNELNEIALAILGPAVPHNNNFFIQTNHIANYLETLSSDALTTYVEREIDRAIIANQPGVIKLLFKAGERVAFATRTLGSSKLICAASEGDKATVECLLKAGISARCKDEKRGWPVIIWASMGGFTPTVELLIAYGADVNEKGLTYGATALISASGFDHNEVVKTLLANHASVDERDLLHQTAMTAAILCGSEQVVETLIAHGVNINLKDMYGQTPLMTALLLGNLAIAECLINHGATPNNFAKALMARGVSINPKNVSTRTALSYAADLVRNEVEKLLLPPRRPLPHPPVNEDPVIITI